jgi:hypothetical protein|tara:strand:+ start:9384 stop:9614 length:231 start_codon:yes stop_codon:yes gene_type:complete
MTVDEAVAAYQAGYRLLRNQTDELETLRSAMSAEPENRAARNAFNNKLQMVVHTSTKKNAMKTKLLRVIEAYANGG